MSKAGSSDRSRNGAYRRRETDNKTENKTGGKTRWLSWVFIVILVLYPLRHIHWGLDLWDTGYNYANFAWMGLEHMDSMWLFSTYLANAVGHFLTKLPFAGSLLGMNFYTGLFVSLLALMGYFFCTKKLGISPALAFLGELAAISLCWCPTALLYNYLTYVLFLACVLLLYKGLTEGRSGCLFAAGICLGANVLVRFSNLPEAAMIVAVWAYGVIEVSERKKKLTEADKTRRSAGAWRLGFQRTLWCLGGYLTALLALFGYLQIRYGLDAYAAGIRRLFAMTDNATDYKAESMLMGMIHIYTENLYWAVRIAAIVAMGMLFFWLIDRITSRMTAFRQKPQMTAGIEKAAKILWAAVCAAMLGWLYYRGFCSFRFNSYDSILRPGILFLMLTMLIALIRIFQKNCAKEEKLISGMLILVILLTSIGSNNGVYPSLNNLFLAAPYTLWECRRFFSVGNLRLRKLFVCSFPAKGAAAVLLILFLAQSIGFGACFVFVEATGAQEITAMTDNNKVLRGIKMSGERAEWMESLSGYVSENGLEGRNVILYGGIPALSFYLQMPAAFNPWPDLRSYSVETMKQDLARTEQKMESEEAGLTEQTGMTELTGLTGSAPVSQVRPVIILESSCVRFLEGGSDALRAEGFSGKRIAEMEQDEKLRLIEQFIQTHHYHQTFSNDKFVIWE